MRTSRPGHAHWSAGGGPGILGRRRRWIRPPDPPGEWENVAARKSAQELFGPAGTPKAIVIGAGLGGVAAGVKLKAAGIETFRIFERSASVGGTWWDNRYPGC